jgi:protein-tyrosine phosphatase
MVTKTTVSFTPLSSGCHSGRGCPGFLPTAVLLVALILFIWPARPANALDTRWVDVKGTSNFRDMGGYPAGAGTVKSGVLFRSDDLSKVGTEGVEDLVKLGIVTVVDLRAEAGDPARIEGLSRGAFRVVRLPMRADSIKDKNDYFKRMIVNSRQSLIDLLVLLADKKNLPIVIFDEDGINQVDVAGEFILLTIGVNGPDVISEYLLSNKRGAELKPEWGEIIVRYFDEYGGMEYYTTRILGLSSDQIGRIRENLIIQ